MQKDDIAARIEAFDDANGGGVGYYEGKGAYHLYLLETEAPIARLKPTPMPLGGGYLVKAGQADTWRSRTARDAVPVTLPRSRSRGLGQPFSDTS